MWYKSSNSNNVKPLAVDTESSNSTVYFRRAFELIEQTEDRPEHWEYEEQAITKDLYDTYINIQDVNDAITELAEIIAEVVNG